MPVAPMAVLPCGVPARPPVVLQLDSCTRLYPLIGRTGMVLFREIEVVMCSVTTPRPFSLSTATTRQTRASRAAPRAASVPPTREWTPAPRAAAPPPAPSPRTTRDSPADWRSHPAW
eukprot:2275566-Prymnesium_polylepis.1